MKDIQALSQLDSFTGTTQYYNMGIFPSFVYTDGAKHLAEHAEAYWLLQEIAGAQNEPKIKKDPSLQDIQFWTLRECKQAPKAEPYTVGAVLESKQPARPTHMAELVCERDSNDPAFVKPIPFTDFPFEAFPHREARIWVAPTELGNGKRVMVAYLPSEH